MYNNLWYVVACVQEEKRKKQILDEMTYGSKPAAAAAAVRKRRADPAPLMSPRNALKPKQASVSCPHVMKVVPHSLVDHRARSCSRV